MGIPVQLTVGLHTRVSVVEDHFHLSAPYSYWCWLAPSPTPSVLYNGFCDIMMKRSKTVPLFSSCSTAVSSKSFRNKVSLLCWCLKPAVDKVYGKLRTVLETLFCRCTYCGRQERYSKNTRPLKDCSKGTGEIKKYESHRCIDQIYMWPLDRHSIGVLHFCCIKSERVGSKSSKLFISFNQNEVYWLSHVDGEKTRLFVSYGSIKKIKKLNK